jgi:hypothetical protein
MKKRHHSPLSKADLLPFPRAARDQELLECHLCLSALLAAQSTIDHLIVLAKVLKISNFLAGDGYGEDARPVLEAAQDSILKAQLIGRSTGRWQATEESLWRPLGALLGLYKVQLEHAPSFKVTRAVLRTNQEALEARRQDDAPLSLAA